MQRIFDTVTDRRGNALGSAVVTIYDEAGSVATIFSDDGVTTVNNPLTTNADGEFTFFIQNGKFTTRIQATGYATEQITERVAFDPADDRLTVSEIATAAYSLTAENATDWLDVNYASTAVVTVADVFEVGESVIFRQKGGGQVVLAESGVSILTSDTKKTRVQNSVIGLTKIATAIYSVYGDTEEL